MRRAVIASLLCVLPWILTPTPAITGEVDWLELLQSDVRAEKVTVLTEAMQLSEPESEIFWSLYRQYEQEHVKIDDQRVALLKFYTRNYSAMTDDKAKEIADRWFELQEDKLKLKKRYFKKVERRLSAGIAARFIQVEHQLGLLIDLQITMQLPLVKPLD
jgi:hypothetical protein